MTNKLDELKVSIQNTSASIILITETWLSDRIPDTLVNIPGYIMLRRDRGTEGGGVCIFVQSNIAGYQVSAKISQKFTTNAPVESLWLEITISKIHFLVACIYRPKQKTTEEQNLHLVKVIEDAMSLKVPVYITGDFNYPEINWNTLEVQPYNQCSYDFLESYKNHRGHQHIVFPTRVRGDQVSLLDLLISNEKRLVFDIQDHAPLGKSDHVIFTAKTQLHINPQPTRKIYKRHFWKADYADINNSLLQELPQAPDTVQFEDISEALRKTINKHVPYEPTKVNTQKPWLTNKVFKEIQRKRDLWHKYRNNQTQENYKRYQCQNNITIACIITERENYERSLINNPKQFYAYVNRSLNSRHMSFNLVDKVTQAPLEKDVDMAECFAKQFQSVFTKLDPNDIRPNLPRETYSRMEIRNIIFTPQKVEFAINTLKVNSSPGPDEIPPTFLKNCLQVLRAPLATMMNNVMGTGHFPETWKKAIVVPIYKKGNKQLAENYRPISLTSVLCKCMEKIISKELTDFFLEAHVVPAQQHGFLPGRSTFTNLLTRLNEWTMSDDDHQPIDVVYLDFQKAFDKIPIEYLIHKLDHYGVRGDLLRFIGEGFLSGRTFCVRVGAALSHEYEVHSGVPQGSVLGPLLFIGYLHDLYTGLKTSYSSFADDTNVFCNPLWQYADLQGDLETIKRWTQTWKMPLNDSKCTVLHIGHNNPKHNYFLQQTPVTAVTNQKDLGITITSDLKWEMHIIQMTKKANSLIYLIQKSFKNLSRDMVLKIYKLYIRPKLEYAQSVWNPYYAKDIELIERVQRRITRLPHGLKDIPYEDRLKTLNITTLRDRRIRGDLIETFKILNGHYSCSLNIYNLSNSTNLRGHHQKLTKEKCNKLLRRNFLSNRVVYHWNSLSPETISSTNRNQFKNLLDPEMKQWTNAFIHYPV